MPDWKHNADRIHEHLHRLRVSNGNRDDENTEWAFSRWRDHTLEVRETARTVYLVGNGASASMASHVSADLAKNAHVHTEGFFDLSLITAIANDLGYEQVFAEPLRRRLRSGDMLVAISSSGRSANILRAVAEAKRLGGFTVTLSAMDLDNPLRHCGHLNFYVPARTYGLAETCHATILHYWIDSVAENGCSPAPDSAQGTPRSDAP